MTDEIQPDQQEAEGVSSPKTKGWFTTDRIIAISSVVVSVLVSLFFYQQSVEKREPVYYVTKSPTLIYDKDNASPKLRMLVDDSVAVEKNVYVVTLIIWNQGKKSIDRESIRKPISIQGRKDVEIIDYSINKEYPDDGNFTLKNESNVIELDWKYFDHLYGAEIQVTYLADDGESISVVGTVEGNIVNRIEELPEYYTFEKWRLVLGILIMLVLAWSLFKMRNKTGFQDIRLLFTVFLVIGILSLIPVLYSYIFNPIYPLLQL